VLGLEAILLFADSLLGAAVAPVAPSMSSASPPDSWFGWVMLGLLLSIVLVVLAVIGVTRTSPLFECGAILASCMFIAYALRSSVKLTLPVPPGVMVGIGWGVLSIPVLFITLARRKAVSVAEDGTG
jgi:hypothetical protein